VAHGARVRDLDRVVAEIGELEVLAEETAVGVGVGAEPPAALGAGRMQAVLELDDAASRRDDHGFQRTECVRTPAGTANRNVLLGTNDGCITYCPLLAGSPPRLIRTFHSRGLSSRAAVTLSYV
jgi:hypothetical protein